MSARKLTHLPIVIPQVTCMQVFISLFILFVNPYIKTVDMCDQKDS